MTWGDTAGGLRCVFLPGAYCCAPKFAFLGDRCLLPCEVGTVNSGPGPVWGEGLGGAGWPSL